MLYFLCLQVTCLGTKYLFLAGQFVSATCTILFGYGLNNAFLRTLDLCLFFSLFLTMLLMSYHSKTFPHLFLSTSFFQTPGIHPKCLRRSLQHHVSGALLYASYVQFSWIDSSNDSQFQHYGGIFPRQYWPGLWPAGVGNWPGPDVWQRSWRFIIRSKSFFFSFLS